MKNLQKSLKTRNVTHLGLVLSMTWMLMGNTQCQQESRVLRKNVSIIGVEASDFMDTPSFSFSEVAQSQLSGVLSNDTKYFYERSIYPSVAGGIIVNSGSSKMTSALASKITVMNQKTVAQIQQWLPSTKTESLTISGKSSCLVSKPQHMLYGKINALEATSGGSLSFGFNQSSIVNIPLSGNLSYDKMRMDLSFKSVNPWTAQIQKAVNSSATKTDYKAGFGIDLGIIHIGPEFYKVTGMSEVTKKGLINGVNDLAKALLATDRQEWQTRVLYNLDTNIIIVGGAELGLKVGDKLKVENEAHTWQGTECGDSSVLLGSVSKTSDPWIVEIVDAGDLISNAKILNPREDDNIEIGALVRVSQLASATTTTKGQ